MCCVSIFVYLQWYGVCSVLYNEIRIMNCTSNKNETTTPPELNLQEM